MSNTISIEVPCVNLNGNSKNDLIKQVYGIKDAIRLASSAIVSSDIAHGRNASDPEHYKRLRDQQRRDCSVLLELYRKYEFILDKIAE